MTNDNEPALDLRIKVHSSGGYHFNDSDKWDWSLYGGTHRLWGSSRKFYTAKEALVDGKRALDTLLDALVDVVGTK